jgi:hypothetical protein
VDDLQDYIVVYLDSFYIRLQADHNNNYDFLIIVDDVSLGLDKAGYSIVFVIQHLGYKWHYYRASLAYYWKVLS